MVFHRDVRQGGGTIAAVLVQKLGLADAAILKDHGEENGIREGGGHLPGEGLVFLGGEGAEGLDGPFIIYLDVGQGGGGEGLGHRPEREGHKARPQVRCGDGRLPVRRDGVLGLQDILHPVGDAVHLVGNVPLDILYLVGEGLVLPVHGVQLFVELPGGEEHRQDGQGREDGMALVFGLLGQGGEVALGDLLHHF